MCCTVPCRAVLCCACCAALCLLWCACCPVRFALRTVLWRTVGGTVLLYCMLCHVFLYCIGLAVPCAVLCHVGCTVATVLYCVGLCACCIDLRLGVVLLCQYYAQDYNVTLFVSATGGVSSPCNYAEGHTSIPGFFTRCISLLLCCPPYPPNAHARL